MTKVTSAVLDALDVADNKFSGAGQVRLPARRAKNICIRPCDGGETFNLPPVTECNNKPNDLSEIPTPQIDRCHQHLRHVACHIPELDQSAEISLFVGKDISEVHHVKRQVKTGMVTEQYPYHSKSNGPSYLTTKS